MKDSYVAYAALLAKQPIREPARTFSNTAPFQPLAIRRFDCIRSANNETACIQHCGNYKQCPAQGEPIDRS